MHLARFSLDTLLVPTQIRLYCPFWGRTYFRRSHVTGSSGAVLGKDGGGDTQPVVSRSVERMWSGTTDSNRAAKGIFFNDGSFYLFYTAVASPAIAGVIQGGSTAGSETVTSSAIAGKYSGELRTAAVVDTVDIPISSGGALLGAGVGGCQVTGVVLPKKQGNAYDFVLTFGPSPCVSAFQTFTD